MQRSDAENLLRKFYSARTTGDVNAAMELVTDDMHFELVGSTDHSDVPIRTDGAAEFGAFVKCQFLVVPPPQTGGVTIRLPTM